MKARMLFAGVLILVVALLTGVLSMAATPPLVPFDCTGDLFVLEHGCACILRITPAGVVSVEITKAEILAATGQGNAGFFENGIAFDAAGAMYFTEWLSESILKRTPGGALTVLTTQAAIMAATGDGSADINGIAFGDDGFLYVNDDTSNNVLRVNPATGAVSVYVTKAQLEALVGHTNEDLEQGIVGAEGGVVYTASPTYTPDPQAIFHIAPGGTPSVLASGAPFDPGQLGDALGFMTRAADGDLIVADQKVDAMFRVTPAGAVSTFLSEAQLEAPACVGGEVDPGAGIAFDGAGNFYMAENNTDAIYRFYATLQCSQFVSAAAIQAATGVAPVLDFGGIAFAPRECPVPVPVGGIVVPVNKLGLLAPWLGLVGLMAVAVVALVVRRHRSA
jgi:streptogramin lyase